MFVFTVMAKQRVIEEEENRADDRVWEKEKIKQKSKTE